MTTSLANSIPGHTPEEWAETFLTRLGMPVTYPNAQVITSWEYAESGGGGGMWNPLNTTQPWPGATDANSIGVKNYLSWEDGLAANAKVIHNGLYDAILAALRAGTDTQAIIDAIIASQWGTKHISLVAITWPPPPPASPQPDLRSLTVLDTKHASVPSGRTRFVKLKISSGQFQLISFNGAKIGGYTLPHTQHSNGAVLGVEPEPDGVHFVVTADDGGTFRYAFVS